MTKVTNLNERALREKPGRHRVADNLFLKVLGPTHAYWVVRYSVGGVSREISLGSTRKVTRADATGRYHAIMAEVNKGVDPLTQKRTLKASAAQPNARPSFGECADQYLETHQADWRSSKHRWQWTQTLTTYAAPIRNMPVDEIKTAHVLTCLKPLWARAPVTASRLRGRIEKVLDAARALGHIDEDKANPARWKGHLDHLLPKRNKLDQDNHHKALPYADVPELVKRLRAASMTALALEFLILTATRSGETLGTQWDEIDFLSAVWTIPPGRMKTNEAFDVPLCDRALFILRTLEAARGKSPFVFAGRPQRPLGHMALTMVLRRMDVRVTAHGFRTSFRTWASDVAHAEFEIAELCLSHRVGSAVSRAYNRTSMLERRRPLMQAWADFVIGANPDNVVPLRRGAAGE